MEKRKLLLVAVSVGVVLLILIGIPLMMIAPRQHYAEHYEPANAGRDWSTAVEPRSFQPTWEESSQPFAAVAEPEPPVSPPVEERFIPQPEEFPHVTTIMVPVPETAAVPTVSTAPAPKAVPSVRPAADRSVPAAARPAPAKPAPAQTTAKPSTPKAAEPAVPTYNNYWVQTGAFSTNNRAETVKESLANKGIASVIDNRVIDGKTWYRVRVGPYISETEAKYWLALVKSIDGFADSQIRLTQAPRN